MPALKALVHHGDQYDVEFEAEVFENHWLLSEMLRSAIEGVK